MPLRFDDFLLDADERQLRRGGTLVELSSRYFDALTLLVAERGRLVTKDRFLSDVWRGVPVTDEALTQCIRTLRRQLGDDAARPRFIETVPKHGYRFIAEVNAERAAETLAASAPSLPLRLAAAGVAGSAAAGAIGGLVYGIAAAAGQAGGTVGATSVLVVLLALTLAVALIGGGGVSLGIAAARSWQPGRWWAAVLFPALGGLLVGAIVKLIGIDAFTLVFGHAPTAMTGGVEGTILGAATGLAAWLGLNGKPLRMRRAAGIAAALGALAGLLATAIGGELLGGSLDLLAREYRSSFDLAAIGALFGEPGFGPATRALTAALEGALFSAFLVGAMALVARRTP